MPDINLIEDTKTSNGDTSSTKKVAPSPLMYSKVEHEKKGERQLMKPSGPMLWLRSLFSRRPKGKPATLPKPPVPPPHIGEIKKDPNDIFADFEMPETVLMTRRASAEPRMATPQASRIVQVPAGSMTGATPTPRPLPVVVQRAQPSVEGSPLKTPNRPPATPTFVANRANIPAAPPHATPVPMVPDHAKKTLKDMMKKKSKKSDVDSEDTGSVNLLPEEFVTTFNPKKKLTTLGLVVAAAVLLVGIVDVSLLLWKETQVKKTNDKTAEVSQVIAKIKALEPDQRLAIAYKAQNDVLRQLLNRHVYWTQFLTKFQQYTLPTINYPSGISLDLNGVVTLTGIAPDLETVLQQLAIYQNAPDFIQSAGINTVARSAKGSTYTFVVDITFNPTVFYRPIDATVTKTP